MKFSSRVEVILKSGSGGDGVLAWRKESRVRFGGPDGGNGGNGGDIYVCGNQNLNTLYHLHGKKIFKAKNGENGSGKCRNGRNGEDVIIEVPCGTIVFNKFQNKKIVEILKHNEKILICSGGKGGKGNLFFKSSLNTAPYLYERGDQEKIMEIILELQVIAQVGLLGFPNSGKSTLVNAITNTKSKIGDFQFTTLNPVIGKLNFENKSTIVADIPGIIDGASEGKGLGFEFLKHLNRCEILIHLISLIKDDGEKYTIKEIIEKITKIELELKKYSKILSKKPQILVFNKLDKLSNDEMLNFKSKIKKYIKEEFLIISGKEKINLNELNEKVFSVLEDLLKNYEEKKTDYLEFSDNFEEKNLTFKITKHKDIWKVENKVLEYWVRKIPTTTIDNTVRLKNKIINLGVHSELLKLGVKKEEKVTIYNFEYDFYI